MLRENVIGASVKLVGVDGLLAAFKELRTDAGPKWLRAAVRNEARMGLAYLMTVLPNSGGALGERRGRSKDPGRLRRNIRIRMTRSRKTIAAEITVNKQGDKNNTKNAYYWAFLEWPHRVRTGSRWGSDETTYMQKAGRRSRSKKVYRGPSAIVPGKRYFGDYFDLFKISGSQRIYNSVAKQIDRLAEKQRRSAK